MPASSSTGQHWTPDEHQRFLEAMALYPSGPWTQRAEHVRTRSTRQVMSHAQKLRLKQQRHARGLLKAGRPPCGSPRKTTAKPRRPTSPTQASVSVPLPEPPRGAVGLLQPVDVASPAVSVEASACSSLLFDAADACAPTPYSPMSPAIPSGFPCFDTDELLALLPDPAWDGATV